MAANVRFLETLESAVKCNVIATKNVMDLCERMPSLEVSTIPIGLNAPQMVVIDFRCSLVSLGATQKHFKFISSFRRIFTFPLLSAMLNVPKYRKSFIQQNIAQKTLSIWFNRNQ
jgi:hypothetical protein